MGSQHSGVTSKAHANSFDSQGRIVDNAVTSLHIPHGAWQEDHNQANGSAANVPHYPNTNQDLWGAEAAGPSTGVKPT